jgi:hypothetical protein
VQDAIKFPIPAPAARNRCRKTAFKIISSPVRGGIIPKSFALWPALSLSQLSSIHLPSSVFIRHGQPLRLPQYAQPLDNQAPSSPIVPGKANLLIPPIHPSTNPSIHQSINPPIHPSIHHVSGPYPEKLSLYITNYHQIL